MPSEPRSVVLLVRRIADLQRVSEELSAYLSALSRRSRANRSDVIQGIWVDEEGVTHFPSALVVPEAGGGRRTLRILETTGINGIWLLCWLEASHRSVSRIDLAAALLESLGHKETRGSALSAGFIPVFTDDAVESVTQEELRTLERTYPGLVLSPAYLDWDGGLRLSPSHAGTEGAVTWP